MQILLLVLSSSNFSLVRTLLVGSEITYLALKGLNTYTSMTKASRQPRQPPSTPTWLGCVTIIVLLFASTWLMEILSAIQTLGPVSDLPSASKQLPRAQKAITVIVGDPSEIIRRSVAFFARSLDSASIVTRYNRTLSSSERSVRKEMVSAKPMVPSPQTEK